MEYAGECCRFYFQPLHDESKKTILTLQTVAILSLMVAVLPLMGKSDVIWLAMAMLQRSVVALTD